MFRGFEHQETKNITNKIMGCCTIVLLFILSKLGGQMMWFRVENVMTTHKCSVKLNWYCFPRGGP